MLESPLRDWAIDDRPREKLLLKGASILSEAELLAILIGTGSHRKSAVQLARDLMNEAENNLHQLARLSVSQMMRCKGIGEAKAVTIVAALELGRRKRDTLAPERVQITSSQVAFDLICGELTDLPHEEFWILLLNRANRLLRKQRISAGGVAGTVADPKLIYQSALGALASGIIVAHNHPSGNLVASKEDIELTRKLAAAGRMLDIRMIDHLIVAGNKYYSFADHGALPAT